MVSTNSAPIGNRQELLERILAIVHPLLKYIDEPLSPNLRGVLLHPVVKQNNKDGFALTRDGELYRADCNAKNPWKEAKPVELKDLNFDFIYQALISLLFAKAGQKMEHAAAIQRMIPEIQAVVRRFSSLDLSTDQLVSTPESVRDVSFGHWYQEGEPCFYTVSFSARCPLRIVGCNGFARVEKMRIGVRSVLGDNIVRFAPRFLERAKYHGATPYYCNARGCAAAFGLSVLQIEEVIAEAMKFFRSKGLGFEPISASSKSQD